MLVHGGPGAPGHLGIVGQELADEFRVLEPFERRSGGAPLTVAGHVDDLARFLESRSGDNRAVVIGFSSGTILALAFAVAHLERVRAVALISSATMDRATRSEFKRRLDRRMSGSARREVRRLRDMTDLDRRLTLQSRAVMPSYFVDAITMETGDSWCDGRGHEETWRDMLRLQEMGEHPAAFAGVRVPVLMMHGKDDPHPGSEIRASLQAHIPHLEYLEFERCGHYPWLERAAREPFFDRLRQWLKGLPRDGAMRSTNERGRSP